MQNPVWMYNKLTTPNMHQIFQVTINYLIYTFSRKIKDTHIAVKSNQCKLQNKIRTNHYEHIDGNIFVRDLGNALALTACKKSIMRLKTNSNLCYNDIILEGGAFLDKENLVVKFNSSTRPCYPKFPNTIVKTTEGEFFAQEPNFMTVHIEKNITLLGNLTYTFNNDSQIDFLSHDEGLATEEEWKSLAESIQYSGVRSMLAEDFFTSLCLDAEHCNSLVTDIGPTMNYNPTSLNILTAQEIKDKIAAKLSMNFWEKFIKWTEQKAALICLVTITFQLSIIFLTILDFFTASNEANVLRVFYRLIASLLTRLANCLCKCNIFKTSTNNRHRTTEVDDINNVDLEEIYRQLRHEDITHEEDVNDTNEYNPSILGVFQPVPQLEDT